MRPGNSRAAVLTLPGPALDLNFVTKTTLDSRISFARASNATYLDSTGTMQTAGSNVPRFDYGSSGGAQPKGLLIEETRTNLLLNSATLSTQSVTTTAVATTLSFYGTGTVTLSGSYSGTLNGAGAYPARATLTFTPTAGTLTVTVSGTVLDAQVEAGPDVTSYIATTSAAATRATESASMPWVPAYPFSIVTEGIFPQICPSSVSTLGIAVFDDGTFNNRIKLAQGALGPVSLSCTIAGTNYPSVPSSPGSIVANAVFKYGAIFQGAISSTAFNGSAITSGGGVMPPGLATLRIAQGGPSGIPMDGWIRRIRIWRRALNNAELMRYTT